jgi:ceramide glucosyltransferase
MSAAIWAGWFCALATAVNLLSLAIAWRRFRRFGSAIAAPPDAPPVSLVRPVCGLEAFSEETLGAGFRLDYPRYELIFCVQREDDPVIPLVRRLMSAHPAIPARLLIGDDRVSDNPKLNNCVKGWDAAEHEWIVLADSNVLMPRDYIQRLQASWRDDTGLVCATPIGSRPQSFWAEVECAFLNTLQARWQYVGESVGLGFAQGKSMLWRRDVLDQRGGIRALGREIAEDAAATKLVRRAVFTCTLSTSPSSSPRARERRARSGRGRSAGPACAG